MKNDKLPDVSPEMFGRISALYTEKRPRGRPPVGGHASRAMWNAMGLYGDIQSPRGNQNAHYRGRALVVLTDAENAADYVWLADKAKIDRQEPQAWRPTILAELGRIDDDHMKAVARRICELKPKARDAVAMIPRWRLGKAIEADAIALTTAIGRAIDDYVSAHPGTTEPQILAALDSVRDCIEPES